MTLKDTQDTHIQDEGIEPPQIKNEGRLGKIKLSKLRPYKRSVNLKNCSNDIPVAEDDYAPITIDKHGNIVNGHPDMMHYVYLTANMLLCICLM